MATYYPSLSNPIDFLPAPYSQDQRAAPSTESPHLSNNMMYLNQPSTTSYADLFSGSSPSFHDCIQGPSAGARDEVEFFPSTGDHVNLEPTCGQLNSTTGFSVDNSVNEDSQMVSRTSVHIMDGEQNLICQGLSLSLGTRDIESGVHVPSFQYQYLDPGNLSSHVQAEDGCRSKDSRHAEYFSYNLQGGAPNTTRMWALNNPNCSDVLNEYEPSGLVSAIFRSKYLKAAQLLLDEVVNVQEALKQYEEHKHRNTHERGFIGSKELDTKMNENSSDPHHSTANCSSELSQSECEDLQNKLTKLSSMLDEVDRRYRQYYHQMQTLVSSFEMVAGRGAAKPYTTLALKTISRHFRTLRDAINSQIEIIKKNLGDQDATPAGHGGLPRLRYVDLKLRQQKGFQQFGVMRQSWRPQRGLPESSVSVLRAWLFEHFLHPYPKDSEKTMLARKTGLTRGQVANWFINARVRLWKPMVEEIYKEEFGELDSKTSPEGAAKAATDNFWPPEDSEEELQESATAKAAVGGHMGLFGDLGIQGCSARLGFHNGGYADSSIGCKTTTLKDEYDDQRHNLENQNLSLDSHERSDYHCLDMLNQQERISMWHENCSSAIL